MHVNSLIAGLDAELYYVREGVVNEYAMSWTVKIPHDIHSIYFNWNALTKRPVSNILLCIRVPRRIACVLQPIKHL